MWQVNIPRLIRVEVMLTRKSRCKWIHRFQLCDNALETLQDLDLDLDLEAFAKRSKGLVNRVSNLVPAIRIKPVDRDAWWNYDPTHMIIRKAYGCQPVCAGALDERPANPFSRTIMINPSLEVICYMIDRMWQFRVYIVWELPLLVGHSLCNIIGIHKHRMT